MIKRTRNRTIQNHFLFLIWLVIVLSVWPIGLAAQTGQPQLNDGQWAEGYNGFAIICRSIGLDPMSSATEWRRHPANERLLVVLGRGANTRRLPTNLQRFVRNGGAVLFASDGAQTLFNQIRLYPATMRVSESQDAFFGFDDCPVVSEFSNHPVVSGIENVATNLSGGLTHSGRQWQGIATMPKIRNYHTRFDFMVTSSNDSDRRVLVCSDQSVFSNQMLFRLDNARLALQAMHWLRDGKREHLLVWIDGQEATPADPQRVDVEFPPPSRQQVLDALRQLPPDVLLQFGNEIATLVEDENLVNEIMSMAISDVSDKNYFRALIFLVTFALAGFVFFRYLASESTIQDAVGTETQTYEPAGTRWLGKRRKSALDRQSVARELAYCFYNDVSGRFPGPASAFPVGLEFVNCNETKTRAKVMKQTARFLSEKSSRWWTPSRLMRLHQQIDEWQNLVENHQLVYVSNTT